MTGPKIKEMRQEASLTIVEAARLLKVHPRTWARWEASPRPNKRNVASEITIALAGNRPPVSAGYGTHPNRNEFSKEPESKQDPFTSLIRSLELLRMLATQLKEGNFLHETD